MKRRTMLLATSALPALGLVQPALAKTTLKIASAYNAQGFHGRNLLEFAQEVATATNGEVAIEVQFGKPVGTFEKFDQEVAAGSLQGNEVIMTSLVKELPVAGADAVPFVVSSYDDANRMWKYQRPLVEKAMTQRGLQVLYAVPWPPQCLYSVHPIAVPEDLKGKRMRTYNSTTVRIAELLGAKSVDIPMAGVGQALAEGRIDAMITSAVTGVENKVWAGMKYYYEINAWFPKNLVFASQAALSKLPEGQRTAVLAAAAKAEQRGWAASAAVAKESAEELRKRGIKVEYAAAALASYLKRQGEKFSLEWIREVGIEANQIFIPFYVKQ